MGGAVDSVRCMDVVSSTAIGVDVAGWWMDVSHCRPSVCELLGSRVDPAALWSLCVVESPHLVGPRHQLAVVLEALVL